MASSFGFFSVFSRSVQMSKSDLVNIQTERPGGWQFEPLPQDSLQAGLISIISYLQGKQIENNIIG